MPRKSRKNVGLIGLGIIGSRVANSLRSGGWHVYVWNRTPRAAPNFLASPAQVAEICDIVHLFVADSRALFEVIEAMGDSLTPQHIVLCNATVGPEATREAARMVQEKGAQFLDAPFTGSKGAAEAKQLVYYIGGDDETLRRARPVLEASSKTILKMGKIGDAATIKVATNMIAAVSVQTLVEAYAIVAESGIDPQALREALEHNAVRSPTLDMKFEKILKRDYEPHFSLKHMFKDVQLGIHIANSLDIDLPATTASAGVMYGALTRGWGDKDFSVLARVYQKEEEAKKEGEAKKEEAGASPAPAPAAESAPAESASPSPGEPAPSPVEPPKEDSLSPEDLKAIGAEPEARAEAASPAVAIAPEPPAVAAAAAPPVEKSGSGAPGDNGARNDRGPFIRRWFGAGSAGKA